MIEAYSAGPLTLRRAVADLTREQMLARPVAGKWSTLEVICHLVDSDAAYLHRMKRVIAEDRPLLIGFDENRFAVALAYHQRDPAEELAFLEQGRRHMARILQALPDGALARAGVHSERGLIPLEQLLTTMIEHIPHHVRFIAEKRRALGLAAQTT
jgi:uncharacterized damage-inducible protein DinB